MVLGGHVAADQVFVGGIVVVVDTMCVIVPPSFRAGAT